MRLALNESARILSLAPNCEVSVLLTGDSFIRNLNQRYRGMDSSTDVLSFPQEDPTVLGDIVISVETAKDQAERANWPVASELALLAVHGLLHLAGWDDEEERGAYEMEIKTREALAAAAIRLPEASHPFFRSIRP
jgi:rRNA maturation RNase YbeY